MSVPFAAALPPAADDSFLDLMSIGELVRFQRVSLDAKQMVTSYIRRKFQITKVITPFIPLASLDDFRRLMAETNLIISGSVPLQFFQRTTWPSSNLDLYVDQLYTARVCTWLISHGFEFQPRYDRDVWQHALPSWNFPCEAEELVFTPSTILTYVQFGEHGVINFKNVSSGRLIQVVQCRGTPLQSILNFHSTVVVNLITHEKAYCIFPKATLVHNHGVQQRFAGLEHLQAALHKYRRRGFHITQHASLDQAFGPHATLPFGIRSVSDSQSWEIPWESAHPLPKSTIDLNTWMMSYQADMTLQYSAILCMSKRLRFSYLLEPGMTEAQLQAKWRALQASNPGPGFLDHLLGSILTRSE